MLGDLRGLVELIGCPGLEALQAVQQRCLGGRSKRVAGQQDPGLHRFKKQRRSKQTVSGADVGLLRTAGAAGRTGLTVART